MEGLNLTQIIAEFGTSGLWFTLVVVVLKTMLPIWVKSMEKIHTSLAEVNGSLQRVEASQEKLLNFHTNGRK